LAFYADISTSAQAVVRHLLPHTAIYESVEMMTPWRVYDIISQLCPTDQARSTIVITAGPPCVEHSRVKGAEARGLASREGGKFAEACAWAKAFDTIMKGDPETDDFTIDFVLEMVLPADDHRGVLLDEIAKDTLVQRGKRRPLRAFYLNPRDTSNIEKEPVSYNQPRLFWSTIDIADLHDDSGQHSGKVQKCEEMQSNGMKFLKVSFIDDYARAASEITDTVWIGNSPCEVKLHHSVLSCRRAIGCLCTPARGTDGGRDMPSCRSEELRRYSAEVLGRWQFMNKEYPPWAYTDHNVGWVPEGGWQELTSKMRENIKDYDDNVTETGCSYKPSPVGAGQSFMEPFEWKLSDKQRSTLMANAWHFGVGMLFVEAIEAVAFERTFLGWEKTTIEPKTTTNARMIEGGPLPVARVGAPPYIPWLKRLADRALVAGIRYVHIPFQQKHPERVVMEDDNPFRHVQAAHAADHPIRARWDIDHSLRFVLEAMKEYGHQIIGIRRCVVVEIQELREELEDEWRDWVFCTIP
jgi:hypothetical protein